MRRKYIIIAAVAATLLVVILSLVVHGCSEKDEKPVQDSVVTKHRMTSADALAIIQQDTKLYSAEQTAHKNVVISTKDAISVLGYQLPKPWSKATYIIPIDVTYKACIDLGKISEEDIKVNESDSSITVTLPDPVIEMTSVEIRHAEERSYRQFLASTKSQEFFNNEVSKAEKNVWTEVSLQRKNELLTSAKRNAEGVIADALLRSGFKKVNITYDSSMDVDHLVIDLGNTVEELTKKP